MEFAPHMPVAAISQLVGKHDTRIWRLLEHYVAVARAGLDLTQVTRVGVDETSARRGQDYVSMFTDLDRLSSSWHLRVRPLLPSPTPLGSNLGLLVPGHGHPRSPWTPSRCRLSTLHLAHQG